MKVPSKLQPKTRLSTTASTKKVYPSDYSNVFEPVTANNLGLTNLTDPNSKNASASRYAIGRQPEIAMYSQKN